MTNIAIASAARTAVGSFLGSFANTPAHELGAEAIKAALLRAGVEPEEIARCVVFLASDAAGFVTGSTISANDGQFFS